jgi:ABC-type Zn2+ transport system substrate-binding protein/surface adhesin
MSPPTTTTTLDSQVTVSETGAVETVKVAQRKEDADNDDDDDDDDDKKKDEEKDKEDEDKEEDKKVSDEDEDIIKKREKLGVDKAQLKLIKEKLLGDYDDTN